MGDAYIADAIEVKECAVGIAAMGALEGGGGLLAGHKDNACRLGGCNIGECVKVKTQCKMGRPSGEVTFECFGRSEHTNKRLDYMLIGLFWFFLSLSFFIGASCLSGESGLPGTAYSSKVVPTDGGSPKNRGASGQRQRLGNSGKQGDTLTPRTMVEALGSTKGHDEVETIKLKDK